MDEIKPSYEDEETAPKGDRLAHEFNLTIAEERVVKHLVEELDFDYRRLKRNAKGVDFTYNSCIGIEVKRDDSYTLSSVQIGSINNHDVTLIMVSKNKGIWVEDAIKTVEMANSEQEYHEMLEGLMG